MSPEEILLADLKERCAEWIETYTEAGEDPAEYLNFVLARMLIRERESVEFYQRCRVGHGTANRSVA